MVPLQPHILVSHLILPQTPMRNGRLEFQPSPSQFQFFLQFFPSLRIPRFMFYLGFHIFPKHFRIVLHIYCNFLFFYLHCILCVFFYFDYSIFCTPCQSPNTFSCYIHSSFLSEISFSSMTSDFSLSWTTIFCSQAGFHFSSSCRD